mmetsp:Transcript_22169/g.3678  ORF Transcript_22169/g.3678 Transcript_22169/m.3678 type:complete len:83 (+) Transcript_22169:348-596(+)|eukprot:CAMPEP_0168314444 /NCGR_PEP_ID=MMETSP0210-20121227/8246_1 /TAXON_ID=40633 /ORGANISM="Condylostoma magnum, Strain COL2" /LENGTH=82 /DNA_ID=CAMNT_0008282605 /DNA_START=276 /DNA_END=524 /DNA_ORIENTATION=-
MTGNDLASDTYKGIIPRMVDEVFNAIEAAPGDIEFAVKVGYVELYMEKLKDLLDPSKSDLKVHEDKARGIYIAGMTEEYITS